MPRIGATSFPLHTDDTTATSTSYRTLASGYYPYHASTIGPEFSDISNEIFGLTLSAIFIFGTVGNILSLFHFRSQKRDISSTVYMFITTNDIVISVAVLPVAVSFLSGREPALFFSKEIGCTVWWYLWHSAVRMSIFLVLCLCVSRTLALLKPFYKQKIRVLILVVVMYFVVQIIEFLGFSMNRFMHDNNQERVEIEFNPMSARPEMFVPMRISKSTVFRVLILIRNTTYTIPALVVATSCIITAVSVNRSGKQMRLREIQKSRRRATITILLFALLYGACNIPMVVEYIVQTYAAGRPDGWRWLNSLFSFDTSWNYSNTTHVVLIAANSALNPFLYFWRMPRLRLHILSGIMRVVVRLSGKRLEIRTDPPCRPAGIHREKVLRRTPRYMKDLTAEKAGSRLLAQTGLTGTNV